MKTTKYTDEQGRTYGTNFMLDDIIEAFNEYGLNTPENEGLIKELARQKIEYGRRCFTQTLFKGGQTRQSIIGYAQTLDLQLQDKIKTIGFEPTKNNLQDLNS